MYASPDEESQVIKVLKLRRSVRILDEGKEFMHVKVGELAGYVKSEYISFKRSQMKTRNGVGQGKVVANNALILSKPGSGSRLAVANRGDILYVHYAAANAYWAVTYKGINGFIKAIQVKLI